MSMFKKMLGMSPIGSLLKMTGILKDKKKGAVKTGKQLTAEKKAGQTAANDALRIRRGQ